MNTQDIVQAILAVLGAILTYFLIPWLKTKTGESKWNTISATAQTAIRAAEQLFTTGQGDQKKQYVIDYLTSKGITLDDAIVEGLVQSLFGKSDDTQQTTAAAQDQEVTYSEFSEVE